MISPKIQESINDQINYEFYSGYIYLSMAAHFEEENLNGFASWMKLQWQEETNHGMKLFNYLVARGGRVKLKAVEQPETEFGTPLEVFKTVLEHERVVTGRINDMYQLAIDEKDFATQSELKWFVDEQVEEESTAEDIIAQLELAGDNAPLLLMIDQKLAEREITPDSD